MSASSSAINSRFRGYIVPRLTGGVDHPASIVETTSMAGILPPPLTTRLALPYQIAQQGLLSSVQLERVAYAAQAHETKLPSGARSGLMVGDGTGVGKGRCLAGIILHHWHAGTRRSLWLSASNDLHVAARQDFDDLGATYIPVRNLNEWGVEQLITLAEGVIFATFNALISQSKDGASTRFAQLTQWLAGDDGQAVIVIDESQKAKNAVGECFGKLEAASQTGKAIVALQSEVNFPNFRIVYSSATGYTELRNMGYLTRLGLWGQGTSFQDFSDFQREIGGAGISGME